ncbi:MAG TPA: MBL fold metallo-hydrolase [Candidatus Peribacterales bacterium]|nr:MBL fold metallo-hydrolase [Candidatus Peribacterales bacterium]
MKLISHGAAREVTGSCHELQIGGKRILLDCGLFQGSRRISVEKNATLSFNPGEIDAVILSHAHMDHVGRIPVLWKRGYRGPVFCTYATKDLAPVMLQDGGYLQEKDEAFFTKHCSLTMVDCDGPLYTQQDAIDCGELFKGMNYGEWFEAVPGVRVQFLDAGHVLGAAMVVLEISRHAERSEASLSEAERSRSASQGSEKSASKSMRGASTPSVASSSDAPDSAQHDVFRIGFSGDLGRAMLPIIRDPASMPPVDILICESTYGNRLHEDIESAKNSLAEVVNRTAGRGGKILIPAFSLERTQEILYDLHLLWDEKKIPSIPIIIDSPLASRVTDIFMKHPECYDREMYDQFLARAHSPFHFSIVRYTESVEESKALNNVPGPMIIMAGSGMCEGGRIRHHLAHSIEDPRSTFLAVGYMAEHTLGRRLIEKNIRSVRIFDRTYQKRAEMVYINAYSGHADMRDLDAFIASIPTLKKIFFVHGEEQGMAAIATRTKAARGIEVLMPERGLEYIL